jgi:hypothetical protein
LAGFRKYWRRAMPARISAAGFSCPGRDRLLCVLGRGGTAIDEPAWRFLDQRRLAASQRVAAVSGFRTAAHFQPDASPQYRWRQLTVYLKFEHAVVLVLTALLSLIISAIWKLALKVVFGQVLSDSFDLTDCPSGDGVNL